MNHAVLYFFICIPVVFSNAMLLKGGYSLAIQFIFSLDNFENPATVLFSSSVGYVIICKDTF
jgi:hypothetical protein